MLHDQPQTIDHNFAQMVEEEGYFSQTDQNQENFAQRDSIATSQTSLGEK